MANTNKAKAKVAAKVAKAKDKIAKKCAKKCACAIVAFCAICTIVGCGSNPAAYSVTQNNNFDGCTFTFGPSNTTTNTPAVELFTLAQNLENGGSQTADQTVKTDVSPEVAVGVGGSSAGVGGTGGASKQGVGAALGAAVDAVTGMFAGDGSADAKSAAPAKGANAATECADGSCEIPGACEDCEL